MFNRILIALGIRKKVVPDTKTIGVTLMTMNGTYGKLGPRSAMYLGGTRSTQVPPKAPPPFRKRLDPQPSKPSDDIATQLFYNTPLSVSHDSPPCEVFAGKGGEFSGAGASGSWDSPSTSSSDTSSSSSDSGSSSCGSD